MELHGSCFAAAYAACDRKGPHNLEVWLFASHMMMSQANSAHAVGGISLAFS
jgi:hypothetical protein